MAMDYRKAFFLQVSSLVFGLSFVLGCEWGFFLWTWFAVYLAAAFQGWIPTDKAKSFWEQGKNHFSYAKIFKNFGTKSFFASKWNKVIQGVY